MNYLDEVSRKLDLAHTEKAEVIRELASHYNELSEGLLASGMRQSEIDKEAAKRFGNTDEVAARLNAVHNVASWKSALLAAVPLLGLLLPTRSFTWAAYVFYGVMAAGVIRELMKNSRPVWLGAWSAVIFYGLIHIGSYRLITAVIGVPSGQNQSSLFMVALVVLPIVLILLAVWRKPRWRYLALCLGAIAVVCVAGIAGQVAVPVALQVPLFATLAVAWLAISVVFAMYLFVDHPHGSGAKATLYLLVFFIMETSRMGSPLNAPVLIALNVMAAAAVVVWFTRASSRKDKLAVVGAGFALVGVMRAAIVHGPDSWESVTLATVIFLPCVLAAAAPLLIEYWKSRQGKSAQVVQ